MYDVGWEMQHVRDNYRAARLAQSESSFVAKIRIPLAEAD
jgi:hypothetical protein